MKKINKNKIQNWKTKDIKIMKKFIKIKKMKILEKRLKKILNHK